MNQIENQTFDQERALYASHGLRLYNCRFDGPADGESALKESRDIEVDSCYFNLRYPFWHNTDLAISCSELTPLCRAALWYSRHIRISGTKSFGIKALRECADVTMSDCEIRSPEFGWSVSGMKMQNCTAESEYFMLRSKDLRFDEVTLQGKYSFQYIEDSVFEHCNFDTKDAFWHAKRVTIRNSVIKGEYLGWYCEDVTFVNCKIIGTQPLCYCKNLTLIDCEMIDTDLCFEKSVVEATLTTPVISIKNPLFGHICAPNVGQIILDDENAHGEIILSESNCA